MFHHTNLEEDEHVTALACVGLFHGWFLKAVQDFVLCYQQEVELHKLEVRSRLKENLPQTGRSFQNHQ